MEASMAVRGVGRCSALLCGMLVLGAVAQEPGGQPATAPVAAPATRPAEKVHVVKRGTLSLDVNVNGVLSALDPHEVKLKLKSYAGPLEVVAAASHGAAVKQGEVLLELDAKEIGWAVEAAQAALASAQAN